MNPPGDLFNPLLHITAGQLRACGVVIRDEVPDCGWVPRDKVDIRVDGVNRGADEDPDVLIVEMSVRFDAEFQWCSVTVGKGSDQIIDCEAHGKVRGISFIGGGEPACGQCFCEALTNAGAEFSIKERSDEQG